MDVSFTFGLPPVPDCFSKLLVNENESPSALPNQPWREAERLRELKDVMLKSLAQESVPETPLVVNGEAEVSETTLVESQGDVLAETRETGCNVDDPERTLVQSSQPEPGTGPTSSYCRLNTSLHRLKREMVDLRHLDMSLFCQLLSLNEAIQDFKMSINDRYSDYTGSEYTCSEYAGSEYSFGGMGSRTGSFSSLNDENDWGGDFQVHSDFPHSPSSAGDDRRSSADELATSTSSLLQQITALTQRAEADF